MSQAQATRFAHLHLHTDSSFLDGANRIDRLVQRVKELGMDAVAITDHGNLHGVIPFYEACVAEGIKPLLGIEAYVAPGDRTNRTPTGVQDGGFHLVLLAENLTGWHNLLKLSSDSYLNGFYYKPRMDKTTLAQWNEGLIAINGHLGSSLAHLLQQYEASRSDADWQRAVEEARWHAETFAAHEDGAPRFFMELQRHLDEQERINPHIVRLARELELPLVCDNDAHFLKKEDWDAHDTLCCINTGKEKRDENRFRYPEQLYVKSPQEMAELFDGWEADPGDGAGREAIANVPRIADRCNVELDFTANHAPLVRIEKSADGVPGPQDPGAADADPPVGSTYWFTQFGAQYQLLPYDTTQEPDRSPEEVQAQCDQALRELVEAGLVWRYGRDGITEEHRERLEHELAILSEKRISAYFLICWDFVNEARRRGIPSSARGSGVGTMVGYCLGLSNACPVRFGLLFERFTDPDRAEYPDIDIDICQDGRAEVLEYVRQKYGHVAQIITFGTLKARAAIRDVGRVLGIPLSTVDRVCKLVGEGLGVTIETALEQEPQLKQMHDEDAQIREMLQTAQRLEGLARHAGIHAAAAVVATQPLENIVPLYRPPGTEQTVTQWDGPTVEKMGLLKMDFLGLRTLTIIERAKSLVRQSLDAETIRATIPRRYDDDPDDPLELERVHMDDPKVLDLFQQGETGGVFQFESGGMRNLLMSMQPDRLEDLIVANALYRPGPMDLIPTYVERKHGRESVPSVHPVVDKHTADTYGIMVYQEQVMQIVHELGGIPLRTAYTLIKAISKKKQKEIDKRRPQFLEGAQSNGLSEQQAQELFELIMKFAGYGFNKSHSSGYAIIAYQTAYLKTYFPLHYMAALLTYESVNSDKVVEYIEECRRTRFPNGKRGIEVKPPDINLSNEAFTPVYEEGETRDPNHGHIRFGLSAVKGVGEKAVADIIECRQESGPFEGLYDFCERVPLQQVNRTTLEALIKCGAFDSLYGRERRGALLAALDDAMQAGQRAAADRSAGQMNIFAAMEGEDEQAGGSAEEPALPDVPAPVDRELLAQEKEALGFYVSSHPLQEHASALRRFANIDAQSLQKLPAETPVVLGGMLTKVRTTVTRKKQEKMAIITLEDMAGSVECVLFPETYAVAAPLLTEDAVLFVRGKVDRRREDPNIAVEEVVPVQQAAERLTQDVRIVLNGSAGAQASDESAGENGALRDRLEKLRALLKRSMAAANGEAKANVVFEVRESGRVVELVDSRLRVAASPDLPERVSTVLHELGTCELTGPPAPRAAKEAAPEAAPAAPETPAAADPDEAEEAELAAA